MRYNDSTIRNIRTNALDKQSEGKKRSKIYSTEKINQILHSIKSGGEPDMDPFFHGQVEYRDANITYDYTDEEMQERTKCAEDAEYFIEKYCKFKNEMGIYELVNLRPYQRDIIHMATDEIYDPKHNAIVFKNPKLAFLQARQTGKCVSQSTDVSVMFNEKLNIQQINNKKYGIFNFLWNKLIKIKQKFVKFVEIHLLQK